MRNVFRKKLSVIATVFAFSASPLLVKAGAFTGAQEWTQIMNNIELVLSNATQAETLATDLEQLANRVEALSVQYNQYDTQVRNLQKMADGDLSAMIPGGNRPEFTATQQRYLNLARKSRDIYDSSKRYAESMSRLQNTGEKLKMSPIELGNIFRQAKGAQREYLALQAEQISKDTENLEQDIREFETLKNSIKSSDGAVSAIENVSASNAMVAKIAAQTRQTMNEMLKNQAMDQENRLAQELADTEAIDANRKRQESAFKVYRPNKP